MNVQELQIGDKVDIQYITYTNNGYKRWLKNLEVVEFTAYGNVKFIVFKQLSTSKKFEIAQSDVKIIYRNK